MAGGNKILTTLMMNIEANSTSLKKGLDEAKNQVGGYSKTIKGALSNVGKDIKGVMGGAIGSVTTAFGGLNTGVLLVVKSILTSLIPAIGSMSTAVAVGLGIATGGITLILSAIVGIFAWVKRTKEGADAWAKVMAYIKSIFETMMDYISAIGKFVWTLFSDGWSEAKKGLNESLGAIKGIKETAEESLALQERENKLWETKIANEKKIKQLDVEIAEAKKIAVDNENYNTKQQLEAQNKAIQLTKEKFELEKEIKQETHLIAKERSALHDSDKTELENVHNTEMDLIDLERQQNEEIKALLKKKNTLAELTKKEREELEHITALEARRNATTVVPATLKKKGLEGQSLGGVIAPMIPTGEQVKTAIAERIQAGKDALGEYQEEMNDATKSTNQLIQQTMMDGLVSFGENLGNLLSGQVTGMKGFLNKFLGLIIDFGKSFGKILISIGVAKVALEEIGISGIGAIIAGTALVAGMTMIQGLMKKGAGTESLGKQHAAGGKTTSIWDTMNERGTEMISFGNGAYVHNNLDTKNMLSNMGKGIVGVLRGDDMYLQWSETGRRRSVTI